MDILTLAMAKPKILDTTKFNCISNAIPFTLNELILYLFSMSLQRGAPTDLTAEDIGDAFKKQAHTERPLYIKMFDGEYHMKFPVSCIYKETNPAQLSAYGTVDTPGVGVVALDLIIQFSYGTSDIYIFMNTKILKAG